MPSPEYFAAYFGAQGTLKPGDHWSDWGPKWPSKFKELRKLPFADFCERHDEIELWFDPSPDDQLQLIWLLDHLACYPELLKKLGLRLVAFDLFDVREKVSEASASHIRMVDVQARELQTAGMAWQAYRAPTPEACANVLHSDLSALLMLRSAWQRLLGELPSPLSGLGASEMRFLEMLARGYANTNALFHLRSLRGTYVFGEFELGSLLEGLALGPKPAVAGLGDELRTIDPEDLGARHDDAIRHARYKQSRMSLTDLGKAVLAGDQDFLQHNPIHRWRGGTLLTNERLWRWDRESRLLVAP
ncbi:MULTISPECIES: hypothetical protein [unclassified Bradyrhizobium]|uniref:hypothetical protein n=1 Tax=unclassified Bradyrhizobium TaxID=2631580 RepID=UPI001FEF3DD2|nr:MULTISPECIES: hypothetical protein [unclassified Bradyrhizobium]MDN4981761.1 hypothetical protein [Bradyrhizobium sp. WYCCWR 13022]